MSREEAIRFLRQLQQILIDNNSWKNVKQAINESFDMAIEALGQPEIIHCKYCEHNESSSTAGNACCNKFYGMTDQMGFCHYGERRTDE